MEGVRSGSECEYILNSSLQTGITVIDRISHHCRVGCVVCKFSRVGHIL